MHLKFPHSPLLSIIEASLILSAVVSESRNPCTELDYFMGLGRKWLSGLTYSNLDPWPPRHAHLFSAFYNLPIRHHANKAAKDKFQKSTKFASPQSCTVRPVIQNVTWRKVIIWRRRLIAATLTLSATFKKIIFSDKQAIIGTSCLTNC
jgi:hypothetical protein